MKNIRWIKTVLILGLGLLSFEGCKKPDDTKPADPEKKQCYKPFFWDGEKCAFDTVNFVKDDWGLAWESPFKELLDSMWHGRTDCPYADSAYICIRSFDSTISPYRRGVALGFSPYAQLFAQSSPSIPATRQNYWPDRVGGDSIILGMPSPFGAYDITFYGRFNPRQDSLRGTIRYTTIGNVPDLPECGPIVFTKVRRIQ